MREATRSTLGILLFSTILFGIGYRFGYVSQENTIKEKWQKKYGVEQTLERGREGYRAGYRMCLRERHH